MDTNTKTTPMTPTAPSLRVEVSQEQITSAWGEFCCVVDRDLTGKILNGREAIRAALTAALRAEQAVGEEQRALKIWLAELDAFGGRPVTVAELGDAAIRAIRRALGTARQSEGVVRGLIELCRDALAEELSAWDIDPPLAHVKEAHDKCEEWLAAAPGGEGEGKS